MRCSWCQEATPHEFAAHSESFIPRLALVCEGRVVSNVAAGWMHHDECCREWRERAILVSQRCTELGVMPIVPTARKEMDSVEVALDAIEESTAHYRFGQLLRGARTWRPRIEVH